MRSPRIKSTLTASVEPNSISISTLIKHIRDEGRSELVPEGTSMHFEVNDLEIVLQFEGNDGNVYRTVYRMNSAVIEANLTGILPAEMESKQIFHNLKEGEWYSVDSRSNWYHKKIGHLIEKIRSYSDDLPEGAYHDNNMITAKCGLFSWMHNVRWVDEIEFRTEKHSKGGKRRVLSSEKILQEKNIEPQTNRCANCMRVKPKKEEA